jgi:hypothetical protein
LDDKGDDDVTDEQFLRAFESGSLPNEAFHHLDHLRMAWLYVRRDGAAEAESEVVTNLRRFAAAKGALPIFNETLTRFWVRLVAHVVDHFPDAERVDALVDCWPLLRDKSLPYRHYRRETLFSPAARDGWVMPDLLPLPPGPASGA